MHSVRQLWLTWRSLIKTKSLNTKLSSRIIYQNHIPGISLLTKNVKNCCTRQVWIVPHPSAEPLWETLGMRGNPTQQPKVYSFPPSEKSPLNPLKSFITSPSSSNYQVITLCNLHLLLSVILLYHILNFRLYVHTCHSNLTNLCLLNVAYSMTKALNNRSSPKQNSHSLHLSIPSLPPSNAISKC